MTITTRATRNHQRKMEEESHQEDDKTEETNEMDISATVDPQDNNDENNVENSNDKHDDTVVKDDDDPEVEEDTGATAQSISSSSVGSSTTGKPVRNVTKCVLCKTRIARKDCIQLSCWQCCIDPTCILHTERRMQLSYQTKLLQGTTDIFQRANYHRQHLTLRSNKKNAFRETGFVALQQTIVLWNLVDYLQNSKWKEDAMRISYKRMQRQQEKQQQEQQEQQQQPSNEDGITNPTDNPENQEEMMISTKSPQTKQQPSKKVILRSNRRQSKFREFLKSKLSQSYN